MTNDYAELIDVFWPTIMQAWDEFGDERPVIECDVVRRQVLVWSAQEYINGLSARTREATRRQYKRASAKGGIMVFIRDSDNQVLQSHVFTPQETSERKPNQRMHRTPRLRRGRSATPWTRGR